MIETRPIVLVLGYLLCAVAATMLIPALLDVADGNRDWQAFVISAVVSFSIGVSLILSAPSVKSARINPKTGFVLTALSWLVITAFAGIPFIGVGLTYTDAYFEAMSGLTTTGASVLTRIDDLPRGVLLWRSILQGIGGIGIVVTALILLPFLRIGGMQLFHTESSDRSEKAFARSLQLIAAISLIYAGLIICCTVASIVFGMTPFDAICHALATVSTGGFSTHDQSFGFFRSPALEWICIVFMILGSLPFIILFRGLTGDPAAFLRDQQVRGFAVALLAAIVLMAICLAAYDPNPSFDIIRRAAFNVVSVVTTTGFATEDYTKWGAPAIGLFFLLMFIGGCSGSTTGGIKIYRLQISWLLIRAHLNQLTSPRRVSLIVYNKSRLPDDVGFSIVTFVFAYLAIDVILTVILAATGLDFVTALSASTQALSNVGPGLGDIVGPAGNYAALPASAKWALSFAMLLGRLELFTILILFIPDFWRT